MSIALVHYLHSQSSTVKDICPSIEHTTLTIQNALVKIQTVEIKSHRAYTKSSEPDANHRPGSQEEVQAAAVVEGGVLEDQATEVTMRRLIPHVSMGPDYIIIPFQGAGRCIWFYGVTLAPPSSR